MSRVFVIRFAKGKITFPLYMTEYKGRTAFTRELNKCFGWPTRLEAERYLEALIGAIVDPELKEKLGKDLSIEEHTFGDSFQ